MGCLQCSSGEGGESCQRTHPPCLCVIRPPSVYWHSANKIDPAFGADRRTGGSGLGRGAGFAPAMATARVSRLMNARDWLAAYAAKLGVDAPTKDQLTAVLDLAGEAAHSSERIAAPVACWLAAQAGVGLDEAIRLARQVADS